MTHGPTLPDLIEDAIPAVPMALKVALWCALGLSLALGGICVRSCVGRRQVAANVQQADQNRQAAAVAAGQAEVFDAQEQMQAQQVSTDAAEVARLRREVARLRNAHPAAPVVVAPADTSEPAVNPLPPSGGALLVPAPVVADVTAAQDKLIQALDKQVADQAEQIKTLSLSRDAWRLSAQASAAEAVQLRAALAAQQGLTNSALWRGRIQGLAVGLGSGYLAGRIK